MKYPEDNIKLVPDGKNRFRVFTPKGEELEGVISVSVTSHCQKITKAIIEIIVDVNPKTESNGQDNATGI